MNFFHFELSNTMSLKSMSKYNLDNLDLSFEDIYQDSEEEGEELFDGTLYTPVLGGIISRETRRGFYEELEARVDAQLESDEEEELFGDITIIPDTEDLEPEEEADG